MKKSFMCLLLFFVLSSSFCMASQKSPNTKNRNVYKGDLLIYLEGGPSWLMGGSLMAHEDEALNPHTGVLYENGDIQTSKFSYFSMKYGIIVERMFSNRIGISLGYSSNSTNRTLKAGGGNYEEKNFGEDKKYLQYKNPFIGCNWYFYKKNDLNCSFITRLGLISNGKYKDKSIITTRVKNGGEWQYVYDETTGNYEYIYVDSYTEVSEIGDGETIDFDGYDMACGVGVNYFLTNNIFIGSNMMVTFNTVKFKDTVLNDFGQGMDDASFASFDWNLYMGLKI